MPENERQFAQTLLNAINGGLIILDADGHILQWNSWMRTASGISQAQVRGKSLAAVFPDANLNRVSYATAAAIQSNASTIITHALSPSVLPLRTRSGRALLHDITVSPLSGARPPSSGRPSLAVSVMDSPAAG